MSDKKLYRPRPEARPMDEGKLLRSIADAVGELSSRLDGAQATLASSHHDDEFAGCFLVTGERGTGKTTVLLSAKQHCKNPSLHWLELINVEPLQPGVNFLTLLLIQIRRALDLDEPRRRRVSVLEESATSARAKLDRLIDDAALVWEDIHEVSTRERAHRQVAVAQNFLEFRKHLVDALDKVCGEFAERSPTRPTHLVLAVPIDNIDRSAEHLRSIFKLAQLVTCKHLMLVFAGDRTDIDLFLERSYWRELTKDAAGRKSGSGEDEALAIARRQATSTIRKLLPPSNRVEVELVAPADALAFRPFEGAMTLDELLRQIPVTDKVSPASDAHEWEPTNLLELLVANPGEGRNRQSSAQPLTELGAVTLRMPARGLLDLWLLVDGERQNNKDPIRIARTMLRLIVAESELADEAADLLQDQIILRPSDDSTQLLLRWDERVPYIEVRRLESLEAALNCQHVGGDGSIMDFCVVELHRKHDFLLLIGDGKTPPQTRLPARAAAWFMLLYDLLIHDRRPLVINAPGNLLDKVGPLVQTRWHGWHATSSFGLSLAWPRPRWGTFFAHSLMNVAWGEIMAALERTRTRLQAQDKREPVAYWRRLLALAWIDLTLWIGDERLSEWPVQRWADRVDADPSEELLVGWSADICAAASERLDALNQQVDLIYAPKTANDDRKKALHEWLLFRLPRFFAGELNTGLERGAHCSVELSTRWQAVEAKIARRRRQSLHDELLRALPSGSKDEPAAAAELLDTLMRELGGRS